MASDDVKDATEGLQALSVQDKTSNGVTTEKWGLELQHLYQLAVKFYKGEVDVMFIESFFLNEIIQSYSHIHFLTHASLGSE